MLNSTRFLLFSVLTLFADLAFSQTIPEKKFTKPYVPVFAVNGFVNFSAALRNQENSFEQKNLPDGMTSNHMSNSQVIGNDSQFFFKTAVMDESKAKYGAVAKMEFNFNSDGRNENPNLDQAFLFSEQQFGKFELGNNQAVNQKMKAGPARFARGAGGINGKYLESVNMPMLANSAQSTSAVCGGGVGSTACSNVKLPRFILLAQSPIGHGGYAKSFYRRGSDNNYPSESADYNDFNRSHFRALKDDSFDGVEDATKISYYSPRIEGLQLGVSYTPNSANSGFTADTALDVDLIQVDNIVSFGANYSEDFDNLGVVISATSENGRVKNSKSAAGVERSNLAAYDFATNLSYFGVTIGASYGSWGKSLQPKNGIYSCDYNSSLSLADQTCTNDAGKFKNSSYYTTGMAYAFGPVAASITSIKSQFQKNNYQAVSLGLDYKLSRDLMPYFEFTKFSFKSNQPITSDTVNQSTIASNQAQVRDNQGYVFLTGILISF